MCCKVLCMPTLTSYVCCARCYACPHIIRVLQGAMHTHPDIIRVLQGAVRAHTSYVCCKVLCMPTHHTCAARCCTCPHMIRVLQGAMHTHPDIIRALQVAMHAHPDNIRVLQDAVRAHTSYVCCKVLCMPTHHTCAARCCTYPP